MATLELNDYTASAIRTITVKRDGEDLFDLSYNEALFTTENLEQAHEAAKADPLAEGGGAIVAVRYTLAMLLTDIDIKVGGNKLGTTEEDLRVLPVSLLTAAYAAIREDQNPGND